jgi:hypothetical protein
MAVDSYDPEFTFVRMAKVDMKLYERFSSNVLALPHRQHGKVMLHLSIRNLQPPLETNWMI